jgi:hypothetical protein
MCGRFSQFMTREEYLAILADEVDFATQRARLRTHWRLSPICIFALWFTKLCANCGESKESMLLLNITF